MEAVVEAEVEAVVEAEAEAEVTLVTTVSLPSFTIALLIACSVVTYLAHAEYAAVGATRAERRVGGGCQEGGGPVAHAQFLPLGDAVGARGLGRAPQNGIVLDVPAK